MKLLKQCVIDFFAATVSECETKNELAVRYLREAVLNFLDNPRGQFADDVYNSFFDAFRMRTEEYAFFDILDAVRTYELQTAGLTESQRDHFIHSIWVFLLGLGIFSENTRYRNASGDSFYDFLYRWGLTSLLHDIGYPIEIIFNQFKHYIDCMIDIDDNDNKPEPYLEYGKIDKMLYLHDNYEKSFITYLSKNIADAIGMDSDKIAAELLAYPNVKGSSGYVDHGFYSAIMMMRWNGLLIEKLNSSGFTFEKDIVDAATAILLHNYYKRPLQKTYKLPPLLVQQHPLAFMIILCDELQEWDRTAYGKKNKTQPVAKSYDMRISENQITVNYGISVVEGSNLEETTKKYSQSKVKTLTDLLSLKDIFKELDPDFISTTVVDERRNNVVLEAKTVSPRPLLDELETIAKVIHRNYCSKYPDSQQGKLTWEECDYHFRFENISQARHLFDFVTNNGYVIRDKKNASGLNEVLEIDSRVAEEFAEKEHERWVRNKVADGWCYGVVRDNDKKLHPMMVPYNELPEEEKNKDRAPLVEFAETLRNIGKGLYTK